MAADKVVRQLKLGKFGLWVFLKTTSVGQLESSLKSSYTHSNHQNLPSIRTIVVIREGVMLFLADCVKNVNNFGFLGFIN